MPIPSELTALNQWVVSNADKIPRNPVSGKYARVNDPTTWGSYDDCVRAESYPYCGLVLTEVDPYTIIDLDDYARNFAIHDAVMDKFDTYTEWSPSNNGLHIIMRGKASHNAERGAIAWHSSVKWMTVTGRTHKDIPIADCQKALDEIVEEYGDAPSPKVMFEGKEPSTEEVQQSDEEVVERCLSGESKEKFDKLCSGEYAMYDYPSQSEADLALMSILSTVTRDDMQVARIFKSTALYRKSKGKNYIPRTIQRIRDHELPEGLVDSLLGALSKSATVEMEAVTEEGTGAMEDVADYIAAPPPNVSVVFPPGRIGELAQYFFYSSRRQVKEISLAAALAMAAGIVGRSFNISGTGLNQYIVVVAKTGIGKEEAASAIDRMFGAVKAKIPIAEDYMGPSGFASGPALIKALSKNPCFVSVLGEFGYTLKRFTAKTVAPSDLTLKQALLSVYQKSGHGQSIKSTVYSDSEKNIKTAYSPALTLLGETTPEVMLDEISSSMVTDGLLSRFIILEYSGERPHSADFNIAPAPPEELVMVWSEIMAQATLLSQRSTCCNVDINDEASMLLKKIDLECDDNVNKGNDVQRHLWNRVHLKVLKICAILAVADNYIKPVVTAEHAEWAKYFVYSDVNKMVSRFTSGEIGSGSDEKSRFEMYRIMKDYAAMPKTARIRYKIAQTLAGIKNAFPYRYLYKRAQSIKVFQESRLGASTAINNCLKDMCETDDIIEMTKAQSKEAFGSAVRVYIPGQGFSNSK